MNYFVIPAIKKHTRYTRILKMVCREFGLTEYELKLKKRTRTLVEARSFACLLMREMNNMTYPSIGKIFRQDHSTVMWNIRCLKNDMQHYPKSMEKYLRLKEQIISGE